MSAEEIMGVMRESGLLVSSRSVSNYTLTGGLVRYRVIRGVRQDLGLVVSVQVQGDRARIHVSGAGLAGHVDGLEEIGFLVDEEGGRVSGTLSVALEEAPGVLRRTLSLLL